MGIAGPYLWTDLTLTPGNPKCHCVPCVRAGAYGGQMMHGIFAQVHLTGGPVGPATILWLFPQAWNS